MVIAVVLIASHLAVVPTLVLPLPVQLAALLVGRERRRPSPAHPPTWAFVSQPYVRPEGLEPPTF